MRRLLLTAAQGALAAAVVTACGSAGGQPGAQPTLLGTPSYGSPTLLRTIGPVSTVRPTPSASAAPSVHPGPTIAHNGNTVIVTEDASGSTVRLLVGQHLEVRLHPDGGSWDPPVSNDDAVLRRRSESGGYPDSTTAVADFEARSAGRTTVTSTTDFGCLHTTPRCLPPQRGFELEVVVR